MFSRDQYELQFANDPEGKGDGTFQPQVNYPVGTEPYSGAVGDFNGDGKVDLATANYGRPRPRNNPNRARRSGSLINLETENLVRVRR
jgi:hypothetical protein